MTPAPTAQPDPDEPAPEKPRRLRRLARRLAATVRKVPAKAIAARLLLASPFLALGAGVWVQFTLGWGLIVASVSFLVVAQMPDHGAKK